MNKTSFHGMSALCRQTGSTICTEMCVLRRIHGYVSFMKIGIRQTQGQGKAAISDS